MRSRITIGASAALVCAVSITACIRDDMWQQARLNPLGESEFFADKKASREPVPGTVARGKLEEDDFLYRGMVGGKAAETFPPEIEIKMETLTRGQEQYDVYCAPCHGRTGDGLGMIVRRGFRQPLAFYDPKLAAKPVGYYIQVLNEGYKGPDGKPIPAGTTPYIWTDDMVHPPLGKQLSAHDKWAVVAYIQALKLSQRAGVSDVPAEELQKLESGGSTEASANGSH
ncbi:MAG: hypothetical protein AKCLJLPJ_01683 [Fimbriimonadales bacterium]|nr:MAG: hypothetical protein EDM73_11885 [Armatimonadota bacterium]MBV6503602.1 hypothetical protein [Fimbriimonadales bacterium]MCE7900680.1 hypothetical protein [Armatimonadetes bacterium ATM1]MDL1928560.1 cytochrome c [Fimbriimonadia bacterium ATM]MBC6970042.1 hypothetical protein [Armatimonadota bacterium]